MKSFPLYTQHDQMDCGPTCLRMISQWYGRPKSLEYLRSLSNIGRQGVSLAGISEAAEAIGFRTLSVQVDLKKLVDEAPLPCIVHWNQNHFVVLYKVSRKRFWIADPVGQKVRLTSQEFLRSWQSSGENGESTGIALLMEPSPSFFSVGESDKGTTFKKGLSHLLPYFRLHRSFIAQLIIGLMVGSLIQLSLPFLTQAIVDVGINTRNMNFIFVILSAQLMLTCSRAVVDFIRSWILLHLSTRVNVALISDFLIKIMLVPLSFFDSRSIGDVLQRIGDHNRVQNFISNQSLSILFSFFNLIIFGIVLLFYSPKIFAVFFAGSLVYVFYVFQFLKKREELDYRFFNQQATTQSSLIQLVQGIAEIKLNGAEREKRWEWERLQARLFHINVSNTQLQQFQQSGSILINEVKNIIVTILAAHAVIQGEMTLGMMLAVQYIIGQLNAPLNEATQFIRSWQDARISLERIGEVHDQPNEEEGRRYSFLLPEHRSLRIHNLCFHYPGAADDNVLTDINFEMPEGKVTALVGVSGSGKTTLLKLLLKFYRPTRGKIEMGGLDLQSIHGDQWRKMCGAVMQDGYLFSDSIARNIAVGHEHIDFARLTKAAQLANIMDMVENLPLGFNTKIGQEGVGISQGQRQRILIARAIYKDPEFLFFDEATSSLDANNEKEIMKNLEEVFKGRTVLVIAHRLSTVKNADHILVMHKGRIIEKGNHTQLVGLRGNYFDLVKNQLELGN